MISKKRKMIISIVLSAVEYEELRLVAASTHESKASFARRIVFVEVAKILEERK